MNTDPLRLLAAMALGLAWVGWTARVWWRNRAVQPCRAPWWHCWIWRWRPRGTTASVLNTGGGTTATPSTAGPASLRTTDGPVCPCLSLIHI